VAREWAGLPQTYVPSATAWRDGLTGGELTTGSTTPVVFLTLDDGNGGGLLFPSRTKWEVMGSFFISVSQQSVAFRAIPEFSVFGGPWVPLTDPVIKSLSLNVGASNETGVGEFQVTAPIDLSLRFRWSFAWYSGPQSSSITVHSGYARASRTGDLL